MTTVLGLLIGIGGVLLGNSLEGGHLGSLLQLTAAMVVFGGTLGAVIVSHRFEDLKLAVEYFKKAFDGTESAERQRLAKEIVASAELVRRENVLVLEKQLNKMGDAFMRSVYRCVVDGVDANVMRALFEEEIDVRERRKLGAAKVWADAGGFAPTIGIIGAVLGLISVMANISDTALLGQGIAVAFVATVYGVGSANLIFLPISNKLKSLIRFRAETEAMILEGALAIVTGLTPYLIEQKMRSFTSEVRAS